MEVGNLRPNPALLVSQAMSTPASYPGINTVHRSDTQGILGAGRDDPSIFLG